MRKFSQQDKGKAFFELHQRDEAFIIPNPWDIGTAKLLETSGFEALATTGAGYAFSQGKPDGSVSRADMLKYIEAIASSTNVPVSADLENGYGEAPKDVAETIELGIRAGIVGASIEDVMSSETGVRSRSLYNMDFAAERIRAAVETAKAAAFPFTLTARCENFVIGNPDIRDTIKRLQAYQEAGADVLYAPGINGRSDIEAVVRSVDKPVNVVVGLTGIPMNRHHLSQLGVKRISLGSTLSRAALGEFIRAIHEMKSGGTFIFANHAIEYTKINALFEP